MHRPLWQIVLTLVALGFAVERGATAVVAHHAGATTYAVVSQAALAGLGLVAAIVLWLWRGLEGESTD